MSKVNDYLTEYETQEQGREKRLHRKVIKTAMDRMRRALRIEMAKGKLDQDMRDKLIMSPVEFLSRTYVKVSLVKLYRRYRNVRLQALSECLAVVKKGRTQQENADAILEKIKEAGMAHKTSVEKEKLKEEAKKCAAFSG